MRSWIFSLALGIFATPALAAIVREHTPPFIVTPERVIERMLALAKVDASDTLIDLGSGDGRIVIHAAKRFNARGIGVELMPALVELSRENAVKAGVANRVRFIAQNALAADLREATVLTVYLGAALNLELMPRILATMRPGARVVSHDFGIGAWTPDASERFEVPEKNDGRGGESSIFLWIVPANVAGRWQATLGEGAQSRTVEFSVAQQFQHIEGAVHAGSRLIALRSASLRGDKIAFDLPITTDAQGTAAAVSARVDGETMRGVAQSGISAAAPMTFVARRIRTRPDL